VVQASELLLLLLQPKERTLAKLNTARRTVYWNKYTPTITENTSDESSDKFMTVADESTSMYGTSEYNPKRLNAYNVMYVAISTLHSISITFRHSSATLLCMTRVSELLRSACFSLVEGKSCIG